MRHLKTKELLGSTALTRKGEDEDTTDIVNKALETLTQTVDDLLKDMEGKADTSKLTERLDKLEAKSNRTTGDQDTKDEPSDERKAFGSYLRLGNNIPAEEAKATEATEVAEAPKTPEPEASPEASATEEAGKKKEEAE